jgi:ABC-type sugar transport system permease subunit
MSIVELATEQPQKPAPRLTLSRREALFGYLFISPWIAGFLLLTLIPVAATFVFTFLNLRLNQQQPGRGTRSSSPSNLQRLRSPSDSSFPSLLRCC